MMDEVQFFKRDDGDFDWKLVSENGKEMCGSLQGYTERNDAVEAFRTVAESLSAGTYVIHYDEAPGETQEVTAADMESVDDLLNPDMGGEG